MKADGVKNYLVHVKQQKYCLQFQDDYYWNERKIITQLQLHHTATESTDGQKYRISETNKKKLEWHLFSMQQLIFRRYFFSFLFKFNVNEGREKR